MDLSLRKKQKGTGSGSAEQEKSGVKLNIYHRIVAYLQLREAIRKADKAHEEDRERYYVMPTFGTNGKPTVVIMERRNFRKLKHKGYISSRASVRDLVQECFYFTPYANGDGFITPDFRKRKERQYYSWYKAALEASKLNKKTKKHNDG